MSCGTNTKTGSVRNANRAAAEAAAAAAALKWVQNFKCPRTCGIRTHTWTHVDRTGWGLIARADQTITGKPQFGYISYWSAGVTCEQIPYISLPESLVKKLIKDGTLTKRF